MQFILRMAYMPPLHLKEEVINNFNIYFLKLENLIKDLFLEDLFLEEKANMATLSFMNMLKQPETFYRQDDGVIQSQLLSLFELTEMSLECFEKFFLERLTS